MNEKLILVSTPAPGILALTLNRPESANALNTPMALEMKEILGALPPEARCVILNGAGKHFCAGADLKERKNMDETAWKAQHETFRSARDSLLSCPVPVIAAVHGAVYAGGLELALACDFIYAANDARFALTEASLGIMPGMGGTQTLPRSIGARRAKELLFTAKPFSAEEAYGWGMINKLCDAANLMGETLACAQTIAGNAPLSIKAIKQSVNQGLEENLPEALALELSHYNTLLCSKDRREGIASFNDKRKPVFKGE